MSFEIVLKAYYEEDGVTDVVIPESVTRIDIFAFHKCTSLKKITIHKGTTVYGTFKDCPAEIIRI